MPNQPKKVTRPWVQERKPLPTPTPAQAFGPPTTGGENWSIEDKSDNGIDF